MAAEETIEQRLMRIATEAMRNGLREHAALLLWNARMSLENASKDSWKDWSERIDAARSAINEAERALITTHAFKVLS